MTTNVPVYDFSRGETVLVEITSGGNPLLKKEQQRDLKFGLNWQLPVLKGSNLVVELNGVKTVDVQDSKFASGPFALQFGNGPKDAPGGVIKFRKVQIREL